MEKLEESEYTTTEEECLADPLIAPYVENISGEDDFNQKYRTDKPIGFGFYSTILKVECLETGKIYACKNIEKSKVKKPKRIWNEVKTIFNHDSKFLVKGQMKALNSPTHAYILMELFERGDLYGFTQAKRGLLEDDARFITGCLIIMLEYLHVEKEMVYRDVKPENCCIDDDGYLHLIDFNLVADMP